MKFVSQCVLCKHLTSAEGEEWTCTAFPSGVPEEISSNKHIHDEPYPGDQGIRWEGKSEEAGELWRLLISVFEKSHPEWAKARRRGEAQSGGK